MDLPHILTILLLEVVSLPCLTHGLLTYQDSIIATITRQNNGDTFQAKGVECNSDTCVGLSSGTATFPDQGNHNNNRDKNSCTCQCHPHQPAYREDLQICVDDIRECVLAPFVSGSTSQQIPFVFLPLRGQIIHPSKEISLTGVTTPVCAVSGAKFLTDGGWIELRNPVETDVPFKLYRDEGRTFLQWEGEPTLRNRMGGRLVLVHLKCRELDPAQKSEVEFSPCVAFRVVGTPLKHSNNVSWIDFPTDSPQLDTSENNGLSVTEIITIGVCSILLGLIYVASVFLYLHIRRRRKDNGCKIDMRDNPSLSNVEEGIIKNNPLLGLGRHFSPPTDHSFSDTTESDTDVTPDILQHHDDRKKSMQITSALIHPYHRENIFCSLNTLESYHQDSSTIERLPEEDVSIVETLECREDRPDNVKAIGTTRKKLYFNPAFFEPHLLQTPPPAAIEFLTKIREIITIAKQKMVAKRFAPSLLGIPEEDTDNSLGSGYSRRNSMISLKRENSRRRTCSGCPDCQPRDFRSLCGKLPEFPSLIACESCSHNTDSKQNSIRKWLEDVPVLRPNVQEFRENGTLQSLPTLTSPKRMRSPTRSLPPHPSPHLKSMSPKATSDKGKQRITSTSTDSLPSSKSSSGRRQRKPIVKPNVPPPPAPKPAKVIDHSYDIVAEISTDSKSLLPPPDMIQEAMAVEEETRIPTITKKKMNAVIDEFSRNISETVSSSPNRTLKDYETDSLERSSKNQCGYSTPTEYAEVSSSQPSPSLSSALPMDEEMTMRNAIINKKTGNMTISKLKMEALQQSAEDHEYELIILKKGNTYSLPELLQRGSLVSEVYVNNGYNYGSASSSHSSNSSTLENRRPKVRYDNNKPGHLLIEVEDCPDNYIKVEDSDDFEPDTLDRKPKLSINKEINIDSDADYTDSLERPNQFLLRTTGSFKNTSQSIKVTQPANFNRNFGSLREIYEAKTRQSIKDNDFTDLTAWKNNLNENSEGRILTLEERHSKRQRKSNTQNIKDVPPDIIPPNSNDVGPIYEQPKPPRKVDLGKPPLPPKSLKRKTNEKANNRDTNSVGSSNSSDYEPIQDSNEQNHKYDASILQNFIQSDDIFFKNGLNNQFILQAQTITSVPNLNGAIFKGSNNCKLATVLGKYLQKPEDSGYLSSTDSDDSKKKKSKEQHGSGGSETDESFCDGHSESGAESIETHSVFFDNFRKPTFTTTLDCGVDGDIKIGSFTNVFLMDDGASTDSENVSFKTVVTTRRS